MADRDWTRLIDKRAALREQFPQLRSVMNERPGCQADRDRQALHRAQNRLSVEQAAAAAIARRRQEEDADRFIAEMERRKKEAFLARIAARQQERRTA